jgi:signal transduction histidine kinase
LGKRFNRILRERAEDQFGLVEMFEKDRRAGGRRELDKMKSAFLLAISHELRTPMTAVAGYAALLEEGLPSLSDEEIVEYTHNIGVASRRLERLVSDILDMERLSRGVLEARRRPTDMRALVDLVLEITDTKDAIEVQIPKGTMADIDPGIVERIVENLVRNAIKHTPPRTPIWVRGKQSAGNFTLVVEDAGRGVADDLKKAVFEPFRQGDLPDHAPGTGVGLALVAQFARLHGGRAWVEDGFGGGASFRVSFPGACVPKEAARESRPAKKRKPSRAAR